MSSAILGPWQVKGNPCVEEGAETTFGAQSTFVLPVAGFEDAFILMADRWNSADLRDSRYVWLPINVSGEGLSVAWLDAWDLCFRVTVGLNKF